MRLQLLMDKQTNKQKNEQTNKQNRRKTLGDNFDSFGPFFIKLFATQSFVRSDTRTHTHTHTLPAHSITCPHLYTHKYAPTLCLLSHTTHTLFLTHTSSYARTFFSRSIHSILASSGTYYLQVYNKDTVMVTFDSRLSRSLCVSLSVSHSLFIFCTHPYKHIRMSRHAHTHTSSIPYTHTHTHTFHHSL